MHKFHIARVHQQFRDHWSRHRQELLDAYQRGQVPFVPNLLPEQAVQLSTPETIDILRHRLGRRLDLALEHADPEVPASSAPDALRSPVAGLPDGGWLKRSNMVGINVRTLGSFWNVVKYALTLPRIQDSIHLLPIWEPGVVGSLYGISGWNINSEFYSTALAEAWPELNTVERQLKAVMHLLHALGKAVGMDVIPHTDRFSEIVVAHPQHFEWLQREGTEIVDHTENLHREVQGTILDFLGAHGPSVPGERVPGSKDELFSEACPEDRRLRILFGLPRDRVGREERRNRLLNYLHARGYEPVPATMAPPYRGLAVDPNTSYTDSQGNTWYDYRITEPQAMSRVFGPLARYKLYGRLDNNRSWAIDFDRPRHQVWRYVCSHYGDVQQRYGFDFMRGDMSHVQMRPAGVPLAIDDAYDILRTVKHHIQGDQGIRHFGYFAETFLAPRGVMLYGDEIDHLEASDADATLGDIQSTQVGSAVFLQKWRQYHDIMTTRSFAPSFTVITGDKDDPRFDEYYLAGNVLRLFIAFFLTDMPSYMALGFETRDIHHRPAPNEHYSKLFVFQETAGPKATTGPYVWGRNGSQFRAVTRLRLYADEVLPRIQAQPTRWLIAPDATGEHKHVAWTQDNTRPDYVYIANTGTERGIANLGIPRIASTGQDPVLRFEFSTADIVPEADRSLTAWGKGYRVACLAPGEGRVYRALHPA